jgi:hypothetical protein
MIDEPPFEDLPLEKNGFFVQSWWAWFESVYVSILALLNSIGSSVEITFSDSPHTPASDTSNLVCDTTLGPIVVNYRAGTSNKQLRVTNAGMVDNDVTLNANGSETIHGDSSQTLYDEETLNSRWTSTKFWW